jgi:putative selenate reductase
MAQKLGVEFRFNQPEDYSLAELQKTHAFIVIATGAWKESPFPIPRSPIPDPRSPSCIDALHFLEDSKKTDCGLDLGKRVAVIGGGDVAMDCARAAKRNKGVDYVAVVYRRTREFMPSQREEQEMALADGVEFMELLAPEAFVDGVLRCEVMRLGERDASGRRGIEGTGEKRELRFDTVIGAVGAKVDTAGFTRSGIALNANGLPQVNAAGESSLPGVYVAGDCRAGAATVVKAIADGKAAAADILRKLRREADFYAESAARADVQPAYSDLYLKKGVIAGAGPDSADACRCLSCDTLCEICVDVCPNRANVMIELAAGVKGFAQAHQVVHVDRMCNECGNCAAFCPHAGKPYKDKFTVFSGEEDFADSENPGVLTTGVDTYKLRLEDKSIVHYRRGEAGIPDTWIAMIDTIEKTFSYLLCR